MKRLVVSLTVILIGLSACSQDKPTASADAPQDTIASAGLTDAEIATKAGAPFLDGMGEHKHPITTNDPAVQRYFDQGMALAAGFNHAESIRAFRAAQTLDPDCAMCFWGEALATGPNINVTSSGKAIMSPDERKAAFAAMQKAIALKPKASPVERDYIDALTPRYNGDPDTPRDPLDLAYAESMRQLAEKYPEDDDAVSMFAEALMTTMPWDYWLDGENPKPAAAEVIEALETVMARTPDHPLALHLYIHAVEASSNPGRAEAAADRLLNLVPGSGHLVHMPSHIYWRVGRYYDASEANVKAAQVDEAYIAQCNAQGFYPALYYPHNIHFLWASASMEGRSAVAIEAGEKVAANVRLEQIRQFPAVEFFHTVPIQSLVRFGHWQKVLDLPQPAEELAFSNAIWHYARGVALARQGDSEGSAAEHDKLKPLQASEKVLYLDGVDYPASMLLQIADHLLQGELAQAQGKQAEAISQFRKAVAVQDELPYTEPPFWYYPTRQSLGAALLNDGQHAEAEAVFRADLKIYPRNGWSLFGLAQSLEAQGKADDAQQAQARFEAIWARADVELTSSVM